MRIPSGREVVLTRAENFTSRRRTGMRELVDYLLFVDESTLPGPIEGPTAFSRTFSSRGAVLSGEDTTARYARLTPALRQDVLEILRETKKGLPPYYFVPASAG